MRQQGNALGDLRVLDTLDVGFHQDGAEALSLMLLHYSEGVHADCAAGFLVTIWFGIVRAEEG